MKALLVQNARRQTNGIIMRKLPYANIINRLVVERGNFSMLFWQRFDNVREGSTDSDDQSKLVSIEEADSLVHLRAIGTGLLWSGAFRSDAQV